MTSNCCTPRGVLPAAKYQWADVWVAHGVDLEAGAALQALLDEHPAAERLDRQRARRAELDRGSGRRLDRLGTESDR